MLSNAERISYDFQKSLDINWEPPHELKEELILLVKNFHGKMRKPAARERAFLLSINRKFRFNDDSYTKLLDTAAAQEVYFNFYEKNEILNMLDSSNLIGFNKWIKQRVPKKKLRVIKQAFRPYSRKTTLEKLKVELKTDKMGAILEALYAAYIYNSFEKDKLLKYFNNDCKNKYFKSYYDHLKFFYPKLMERECALIYLVINNTLVDNFKDNESFCGTLFSFIRNSYESLANHCYFAVRIESLTDKRLQWKIFSDLVLYAEKFNEVNLEKGYFNPKRIEEQTKSYIKGLDSKAANFKIANEGFNYKDCFILLENGTNEKYVGELTKPYDLLILFEKNERDETLIPCPACRSLHVQGNSYPILGVRSWECLNPLCPDKSKYNRGKRFQLCSLVRQASLNVEESYIEKDSIRKWRLDVVNLCNKFETEKMLIKHYSLFKDRVVFVNGNSGFGKIFAGRCIQYKNFRNIEDVDNYKKFFNGPFFRRFELIKQPIKKEIVNLSDVDGIEVYSGDAFEVLNCFSRNSVNGAVTSPPYYNAKSYSTWPNIYCYLYDMYNIASQVYRVLKEGSAFLFNIFDYFDNENNIVFSAMGKKRIILGAYIIHLFECCGFRVSGNIIWHKGEIEGKRNFNQGNLIPYYQAPNNCWEHILIFSKGNLNVQFPDLLYAKPVMKMFKGENILGHDAPFPKDIPELLLKRIEKDDKILDPFSGTMTSGRAAYARGIKSISIDYHSEYCFLGLKLLKNNFV